MKDQRVTFAQECGGDEHRTDGLRADWLGSSESTRQASSGHQKIRLDGVKILLVDDSLDNQKLFQKILTGAGAEVDLACNGIEAVEKESQGHYEVIIMDIRMPLLDGYQATRRIRDRGYSGPVIALTAHANPGEESRCRASGCSHFYLKPIDRLGLLTAVAKAVGL